MNSKLEICSFPDGKSAMLALTFDDGTLDHLEIAAPELEKRGWRGTFYINPQSNDRARSRWLNWDGIRELHRRGHEIGNHSMSHTNPQRLAQEKQFEALAWEITEAQRQIFEHTGARPVTYTAPYGVNEEFVSRLLAANNLLNTPPRTYIGENTTPAEFAKILEQSIQPGAFTVIMFHGVTPGYGGVRKPEILLFERNYRARINAEDPVFARNGGEHVDADAFLRFRVAQIDRPVEVCGFRRK